MQLREVARRLGGTIAGRQVLCPGPGHSPRDRSLSVMLNGDGGYIVHSFAIKTLGNAGITLPTDLAWKNSPLDGASGRPKRRRLRFCSPAQPLAAAAPSEETPT